MDAKIKIRKRIQQEQDMRQQRKELELVDNIAAAHDNIAESKCPTCQHYCPNGATVSITTLTAGNRHWHVGPNYCTILGYHPNKIAFPPGLNSPIGEVPDVVECSEYKKGIFQKFKPPLEIAQLETAMGAAEETLESIETAALDSLRRDAKMPASIGESNTEQVTGQPIPMMAHPIETSEGPIVFDSNGNARMPDDAAKVLEINLGPINFYNEEDFYVSGEMIHWLNPTLMVGPQLQMKIMYVKK